jgi:hypothetical protein
VAERHLIQYDPGTLRIPGNSLPIGIVTLSANGQTTQTSGFLKGKAGSMAAPVLMVPAAIKGK